MEVIIDSSVILDSLQDIDSFSEAKKKEDRVAIDKIISLKQNKKICCIRTINLEYEIAKDNRQNAIEQKWGKFTIKDRGIGLKATLKEKYYDSKWDTRFSNLKGNGSNRHIDASAFVQAEYFHIGYVISTDYDCISYYKGQSQSVEVVRPIDFVNKICK
jgi:hypothetical protein